MNGTSNRSTPVRFQSPRVSNCPKQAGKARRKRLRFSQRRRFFKLLLSRNENQHSLELIIILWNVRVDSPTEESFITNNLKNAAFG